MSGKKFTNSMVTFDEEEYNDYQMYLASKVEWPFINIRIGKDSRATLNLPMLIMELHRLVLYKEGRYIQFHPYNMPHIKVRKIDLVGIVTNIKRNANNIFFTIEDGTGVIDVNYNLEKYRSLLKQREEIDKKYKERAESLRKCERSVVTDYPKKFPETRPDFSYMPDICLQDRAVLENEWWSEINDGLLGKDIQLFDYIYVNGYPCCDARFQEIPENITMEFVRCAKVTIFAVSVTCISEKMYNTKLRMWMDSSICQRYVKR